MPRRGGRRSYGSRSIIGNRRWGKSHGSVWPHAIRALVMSLMLAGVAFGAELIKGQIGPISTDEINAHTSASMSPAVEFPKISDFQFSKVCVETPIYFIEGAILQGEFIKFSEVENSAETNTLKALVQVTGKLHVNLALRWDAANLWLEISDQNAQVIETRDSLAYDPRNKVLAIGMDNSDDLLLFEVPGSEGQPVGYLMHQRPDVVEQNATCP